MNELQLLTPYNILSFIGFCIAVFAFLSQYLSFPKELLSELMRTLRINPGELPLIDKIDCTKHSDFDEKKANDHIKTFFIEHDTVTYITLSYILFSILVSLTLLIYIVYFKNFEYVFTYIIIGFSTFYSFIIAISLGKAKGVGSKDFPESFKEEKKQFLNWLMFAEFILCGLMWLTKILEEISLSIIVLIFGLMLHFFITVIIIWKHEPVTKLLFLWERLHKNAIKVNNLKNKEEE